MYGIRIWDWTRGHLRMRSLVWNTRRSEVQSKRGGTGLLQSENELWGSSKRAGQSSLGLSFAAVPVVVVCASPVNVTSSWLALSRLVNMFSTVIVPAICQRSQAFSLQCASPSVSHHCLLLFRNALCSCILAL